MHILNYFLANFGFDGAENEPAKNFQKLFAKKMQHCYDPRRTGAAGDPRNGPPGEARRPPRERAGRAAGRGGGGGGPAPGGARFRSKLYRARSRLCRSQILQLNMRWKALAEIYTMHSFAQLCNRNFLSKFCQIFAKFCKFRKILKIFANFGKF